MTNPNDPAFALEGSRPGLTKREYFAGLAMQGFNAKALGVNPDPELIAKLSVLQADALIDELNKGTK